MINSWIESVIVKRAILALAAGIASHLVALLAAPAAAGALTYLSGIGLQITVLVDQEKFSHFLTVILFSISQGAHEYIASKYPEMGKYI